MVNSHSIVGHDQVRVRLQNLLSSNRMPHALLFSGIKGIGKTSVAYRLAHALFQNKKISFEEVGASDVLYQQMHARTHSDFLVIGGNRDETQKTSTEITVDAVRGVTQFLSKKPGCGQWRVILIDGVEYMNGQAMNALLKKLEEPSPFCIFILITHQTGVLLPTIVSRCQQVYFSPLSKDKIKHILNHTVSQPWNNSSDQEVIFDVAQGSAARAIHFIKSDGLNCYQSIERTMNALASGRMDAYLQQVQSFVAATLADKSTAEKYIVEDLINHYLSQKMIRYAQGQLHGSHAIQDIYFLTKPLECWMLIWQRIQLIFKNLNHENFDPYQSLISVFTTLTLGPRALYSNE